MPLAETSKCRVQTGGESVQLEEGEKASQHTSRAPSPPGRCSLPSPSTIARAPRTKFLLEFFYGMETGGWRGPQAVGVASRTGKAVCQTYQESPPERSSIKPQDVVRRARSASMLTRQTRTPVMWHGTCKCPPPPPMCRRGEACRASRGGYYPIGRDSRARQPEKAIAVSC